MSRQILTISQGIKLDSGVNAVFLALWLGILTSISPCPLVGNIAAVSYIGGRAESFKRVLMMGLLYTIGRMLAYILVAGIAVKGLMSLTGLSFFLQQYLNKLLGPVLILSGMFMLEMIAINIPATGIIERLQSRIVKTGAFGALLLGALFALAFCPVSAALFFGSLLPLAFSGESAVLLPVLYGIGTALPVLLFAVMIAFGLKTVGLAFEKLSTIDRYARRLTGGALIAIGVYFSLKYIFGII